MNSFIASSPGRQGLPKGYLKGAHIIGKIHRGHSLDYPLDPPLYPLFIPSEELCDHSLSPWDDADRRPSHADRRKALRRQIMEHELSTLAAAGRLPRKILHLVQRLMDLAI